MTITLRSFFPVSPGWKKVGYFLGFIWLFLCFTKLPVTAIRSERPQSWEAVLSFVSVNHLQWGKDVVFTYGPLGYLTSDHYWGVRFWPILIWSFAFSATLAAAFLSLSRRLAVPIRVILFAALPWLALSPYADLGFEALYLLAVVIFAEWCFPERGSRLPWLLVACAGLGVIGLLKFTFCLFLFFALGVIFAAHLFSGQWRRGMTIVISALTAFAIGWQLGGQEFGSFAAYLRTSATMAAGYSDAMGVPPTGFDLIWGVVQALCLFALLFNFWRASEKRWSDAVRFVFAGAAAFLAWKEGFVRADLHVVVFFVFSFFLTALLPVLLNTSEIVAGKNLRLTILSLAISVVALWSGHADYLQSGTRNFLPRITDTITAVFSPRSFHEAVTERFKVMQKIAAIPQIKERVGTASIDVLGADQHVAILNGLAYRPHPVFQSYGAYDGPLQDLNGTFYGSAHAPDYVLWRYDTIDGRFPTLDDGKALLHVLNEYSPVLKESAFTLWKRKPSPSTAFSPGEPTEGAGNMDQWFPLPESTATWLKIKIPPTAAGSLLKFFFRASRVYLEVKTDQGEVGRFNLIPANAASGFLVHPLLQSGDSLEKKSARIQIVAFRLVPEYRFCFQPTMNYSASTLKNFALPDAEAIAGK